ncbi:hypothetical protein FisN_3Lh475 [Fistulifera solaris]|uniref:Peptidase C14 caspase domain-containing protein n=1 Tax=Fistulifera solaris TaxID=1519565 RepID=A0A1Z5J8E7_FISSO|nr:hypothetical protein FisN_3Lh475 [Fistulifera solaris]|eukprot:GAX10273.1 hypothetical protein FisN_3Lh475 [Fistulifera solaris]
MTDYDERIQHAIPAEFHMISGSHDMQTSADVFNTSQFELPNPAGKAGGACTSALLQVLYKDNHAAMPMSWVECLRKMRSELNRMGYDQIPQLTSSRLIDVNKPMSIVPPGSTTGHRRAILIGINYIGQKGQLSGCHNDVMNIKKYLINVHNFKESEMLILMDDNKHHAPTRRNIEDAFQRITQYSQAGDVVFVHYSGHGSRIPDLDGDESDGYDETLVPVDFKSAGQIVDDEILKLLVQPMKAGVTCTVLMDCCHSGTVLDLPYRFSADDSQMRLDPRMNLEKYLGKFDVQTVLCLALLACCLADLMS